MASSNPEICLAFYTPCNSMLWFQHFKTGSWKVCTTRRGFEIFRLLFEVSDVMDQADFPAKSRYLRRTPLPELSHLVMIRTVLVTPTRVLVGAPQQDASNSVTRRYADKLDGIIRVQFADEEDRLFVRIPGL